jgi:hypothetical protein
LHVAQRTSSAHGRLAVLRRKHNVRRRPTTVERLESRCLLASEGGPGVPPISPADLVVTDVGELADFDRSAIALLEHRRRAADRRTVDVLGKRDCLLLDDNPAFLAGVAARLLNPNRTTIVGGRVVYQDARPVPIADAATTRANTPVRLDLAANDADPDEFPTRGQRHRDLLFVSSVTQPAHGTVLNLEGSVIYTPEPGFAGTDTFTYRNHDGAWESAVEAVVTVTVEANPVTVSRLELTPGRRGTASLRINVSGALDRATAEDPSNYEIRSTPARGRGRVGQVAPVAQATYDAATNQVTLHPRRRLAGNTRFQITVRAAITDLAGQAIDGDGDGQPGGDHIAEGGLFRKVSYIDRDGDAVDLAIATILQEEQDRGPGRAARAKRPAGLMELIWSADGDGRSLRLIGTTPREHVLRGQVVPAAASDGKTSFQSTTGLANVIHQLPVCSPAVVDACFELGVVGAIA